MQKHVNLVDLVKSFPTNILLQNLASIQKRTSPIKFAHLAEKSEKGSISNLSTKVCAGMSPEVVSRRRWYGAQGGRHSRSENPAAMYTGHAESVQPHCVLQDCSPPQARKLHRLPTGFRTAQQARPSSTKNEDVGPVICPHDPGRAVSRTVSFVHDVACGALR